MKIALINTMAPFIWGGAEELAVHLKKNLILAGHQVELIRLPFQWEPAEQIPAQMLLVRALELTNVDRVIGLKFPAYLIRHPHKVMWLIHQYRQAYDLWNTKHSNIPCEKKGEEIRSIIKSADDECFRECKAIYTISDVTKKRLNDFNGFNACTLPPPLNDPELFTGGGDEGYILAAGRVNELKRQHLLIEAMIHTPKNVKLIIAGPPDSLKDAQRLQDRVNRLKLNNRIKLDLRFLARSEYANYVNNCTAVAYLPYDEDSIGYVTMEAALAGKPLISTFDSGGVLKLVIDQQTGWVGEAKAKSISRLLIEATKNAKLAKEYGAAAREHWLSMGINWQNTVAALTS